jgi:hypothetical protein
MLALSLSLLWADRGGSLPAGALTTIVVAVVVTGADLRVKVLQWGRRPFADDRLASEGRFTELFLPVLGCCDRQVCPPVGTQ